MAEYSRPWSGTTPGDAGPYSDEHWAEIWSRMWVENRATQGIVQGVMNSLAVTGSVSPIAVDTGAAMVDGNYYANNTSVSVSIPTPTSAARVDLIVLRKSWSAQTVRITRIAGTEGSSAPNPVQVDGVTWDIPLAEVQIETDGSISGINFVGKPIISPLYANRLMDIFTNEIGFGAIANGQILIRNGLYAIGVDGDFIIPIVIGNGEDEITTAVPVKGYVEVPVNSEVVAWTLVANETGSIVIDVWNDTYANFPPTNADSITGSQKPTLSSAQKNQNLNLTDWTPGLLKGNWLAFEVESATTVKQVTLSLRCARVV